MESDVVKEILALYKKRGAWAVKVHGGPMQAKVVDIFACYRGVFIAIEAKDGYGKDATTRQLETLRQIDKAQGMTVVAHEAWEALEVLNSIDRRYSRSMRIRDALLSFARLGRARDYPVRPRRLDVPFEWYETAYKLIGDGT